MSRFSVGDKVRKITGDYSFRGTVRAVFTIEPNNAVRIAVQHDECGMVHIFSEKNLEESEMDRSKIGRLLMLLDEIVNEQLPQKEKAEVVLSECSEQDKTNLMEFCSWFDPDE